MSKFLKIMAVFTIAYLLPMHYGRAQTLKIGPPGSTHTFRGAAINLASAQGADKIPTATAVYNYANGYFGAKVIFGTPTDGQVPIFDNANNRWTFGTVSGGGGGTVTSVGLSLPSIFSVSGSPVTSSGTLTASLASQTANTIFAAPNGSAGAPTFRALVAADIPSLDATKINSGTFGIARGGTGLSALGTANQLLRVNAGATALEYFTPSYLTANQTITLSGDLSGSGSTSIAATIANSAVTTAKLADAGVTMAKIAQAGATSGQVIKWNGSAWAPANDETATGGGGVSSVGLSMPSLFSVTGSPVTSSGTLTAAFASQTANTFLAAPNGAAGAPTMRALVAADIPSLDASKIATGTFGTAFIADGAVTTAKLADAGVTMAKIAQAGATSGQVIKWNGSAWAPAADASNSGTVTSVGLSMPSIFSVSGSPVTSSGTLTAALASQTAKHVFIAPSLSNGTPTFRELLPSDINQAGATSGQVIKWNGTNWAPAADATSGGGTDLSATHNATTVVVESSTGNDATISGASDSQAGLVTTGAQNWIGSKTFFSNTVFAANVVTDRYFFPTGSAARCTQGSGSSGGSVVSNFEFWNAGNSSMLARIGLQNGDAQPRLLLNVGGTEVATLHSTGVGIGIGSATPARALEVAGANPIRTPGMTSSTANMTGTRKMVVVNSSGDFGVDAIPSGGGSTQWVTLPADVTTSVDAANEDISGLVTPTLSAGSYEISCLVSVLPGAAGVGAGAGAKVTGGTQFGEVEQASSGTTGTVDYYMTGGNLTPTISATMPNNGSTFNYKVFLKLTSAGTWRPAISVENASSASDTQVIKADGTFIKITQIQ